MKMVSQKHRAAVHRSFQLKGGTNMLSIRKPDKHEILEALCRLENGEELTDRDIWILDEYGDDELDGFEDDLSDC